jgi:two-component system, NarL family, sensor histidine kinase UhpB
MKDTVQQLESQLEQEYEAVLREYLRTTGEAALERGYELGRRALAEGLGALEMARIHHQALLKASPATLTPEGWVRTIKAAEKLFVESMTPFEMTHRGFRETNAALRVSEERYRELFENANDVVFTADLEGNFTSINRAGERLSGYERGEALSMNFTAVVAPECAEVGRRARDVKLSGEEERTKYELEMLTKDGRRIPLEVSTRLIYQEGKPIGVQGIARDITERKQAEQALRGANARLEEEARRIAHALHDEAGQLLASVYLAVADLAGELPAPGRERLEQISVLLDQVAEQLRRLSHELRPIILDDFGLVPALEFLIQGISKRSGLAVTVEASLDRRLPPSVETAVYRIFQETLTNVGKHAKAGHVSIRLQQDARMISCSIGDDGIGFDSSAVCPNRGKAGLGLIGIHERLAALGGTLSITTGPGQGTTLDMEIPLETSLVSPSTREFTGTSIQ